MNKRLEFAKELIEFIDKSYSAFHVVYNSKNLLDKAGFSELKINEEWELKKDGKYYTTKNDSAIVAFTIGKNNLKEGFRLIGSHTDSPGFRIKPFPEITDMRYLKLNTEVYGGPILNTWLDRPLSIAGRISVATDNPLNPKDLLVDLDGYSFIIPNLAIHMNREVNDGFKINPQTHTLPIIGMIEENFEKENFLIDILSKKLGVKSKDILDFELFLYGKDRGEIVGLNHEFISVGKLDNLAMLHASLEAIIKSDNINSINMVIGFDNEEVGSSTKQGAGSSFVRDIMERIAQCLGYGREEFLVGMENSFLISSDMAHAVHPNFLEKIDPTNKPIINGGPCIKIAANQAYTTDSRSCAIYEGICRKANIPVQKFVNRSDARGGSTIGPISSSQIPISSVDIGNPILSMHSIRELGGVDDHYNVFKSFLEFFNL